MNSCTRDGGIIFPIEGQSSFENSRKTNESFPLCSSHFEFLNELRPKRILLWKKCETLKSVSGVGGSISGGSIAFRVFCRFISSTFPLTFVGGLTNDRGRKIGQKLEWNAARKRTTEIKFSFNCFLVYPLPEIKFLLRSIEKLLIDSLNLDNSIK